MLDKVKLSLRVSDDYPEDEITGLIESAKLDLKAAGVKAVVDDALIERAIITYCKAHFGYDNPEADRFDDAYVKMKQHLQLYGDYRET